jgi:peptidoglycan/xylan/chitin deacetylase (PgdA/CDA1 family)
MSGTLEWKRRLGQVYSHLRPSPAASRPSAVVLTYHSIGPTALAVPTQAFREQMEWLLSNTMVMPLDTLVSGAWPDSPSGLLCAITFDDGYASVHHHAFPIMSELGIPATVYLVAGAINDDKPACSNNFSGLYPDEDMLIWEQVRELQAGKVQMGSHLVHHKDLTSLDSATATEELELSKKMIEDRIGAECSSFCFPWGKHNLPAVKAVRSAGYKNAVVTIQGRYQRDAGADLFRIPRADIRREYSLNDFKAVVRGDWDYLGYIQRFRHLTS